VQELGDDGEDEHRRVGVSAAIAAVDVLVVVGPEAAAIAAGARSRSGWTGEVVVTAGGDEALDWVRKNVAPGDVVLVKASRGVALEHVANGLLDVITRPEGEPGG